ncbi:DnaJ domain-containing protein [Methanoculleus chikugoensis]|uniref:J domain-containing protein n=1 Tax=Methanoculleus chikugoensis TaxID=118126 RepID=UPI0006D13E49|nr:J domain-containing protein [Methanoculleus chikugoensis]
METHYEILGVSTDATSDEIRAAYRRLAKRYHPDINHDPDAGERFIAIQQAYETLIDPPDAGRATTSRSVAAARQGRMTRSSGTTPPTGRRSGCGGGSRGVGRHRLPGPAESASCSSSSSGGES